MLQKVHISSELSHCYSATDLLTLVIGEKLFLRSAVQMPLGPLLADFFEKFICLGAFYPQDSGRESIHALLPWFLRPQQRSLIGI